MYDLLLFKFDHLYLKTGSQAMRCLSWRPLQPNGVPVQVADHRVVDFKPHDADHERAIHWIYYYSGLGVPDISDYHTAHIGAQYFFSYYWCASTLSTAGRIGHVTPKNIRELAFTIVSMLFTSVFYGFVMGQITNLVMSSDEALVQRRQKMGLVQVLLFMLPSVCLWIRDK
jgi:hypothetical protein